MIPDITGAATRLRRGAAASFIVGKYVSAPDRTPGSVWRRPDRREVARAARTLAVATWLVVSTFTGRVLADVPFLGGSTVAAGMHHSCAVTSAGGAKCWGFNAEGQLGIGSTENALVPTEVAGLASGVSKVSTGHFHSCALTTTGAVKCWGGNGSGQAGTGSGSIRHLHPEQVVGLLAGARSVVANGNHACAITASGGVKCWGTNYRGQLGTGGSLPGADSRTPVDVVGLSSGVVAIAAGANHSCAVTSAGGMRCWGANEEGQLGNASTVDSPLPIVPLGLDAGVAGVAAGDQYTCALMTTGAARCWGRNAEGQLGIGLGVARVTFPADDVVGLSSGVVAVSGGGGHACALTVAGVMKCWGHNVTGQLGNGGTTSTLQPTDVVGLAGPVASIAAGGEHTCAVAGAAGQVRCWGRNVFGGAGTGGAEYSANPVGALGLSAGTLEVSAGANHTCAIAAGGVATCWGENRYGQLGLGSTAQVVVPTAVTGLGTGVRRVAAGGAHSCAVTAAHGVKCWGSNLQGQLGDGTDSPSSVPIDVLGLGSGVAAVATGTFHSCALTSAGGVLCWGNGWGNVPAPVPGLGADVSAIATGGFHTCALTTGGGVKCWGENAYGQLGNGGTQVSSIPVDVVGLGSGVVAIAAGFRHSCALTAAGAVRCWGWNLDGQLGNGSNATPQTVPGPVAGLSSGGTGIATGAYHSCAATVGGVRCWGLNTFGQLGNGSGPPPVSVNVPANVVGLAGGVGSITSRGNQTCVIAPGGGVLCWGSNVNGELGDGGAGFYAMPQPVVLRCAGFTDVDPGPFCSSVEWIRNRAVTRGCTNLAYCPGAPVSRLAMAAYMQRLGAPLTPVAITAAESTSADPGSDPVLCRTANAAPPYDVVGYPQRAQVDIVFAGEGNDAFGFAVEPVASFDGGTTWRPLGTQPMLSSASLARWTNVRAWGQAALEVGDSVRFGARLTRAGQPGGGAFPMSSCRLIVRIDSRASASPPY